MLLKKPASATAFVPATVLFPCIIYCAAHHGNNLYLRRDAVSFQALGEVVNGRVILTKGLMPLPFTPTQHQRRTRKLTSVFFGRDAGWDLSILELADQWSASTSFASGS